MTTDIIIIGGGPAGLMAACRASELGAKVVLLEKNKQVGIKLLTTGGGRCNITNYIEDYKNLANCYGKNGRFLFSAFSKFGVTELLNFFKEQGIETKLEKNNQIFPVSDKARDVINALTRYILNNKGEIKTERNVKKIVINDKKIEKIILENGEELIAKKYILATGGCSYPLTGSTGDAYQWLKNFQHNIIKPKPGLAPIILKDIFIKELEGLSLSGIKLNLFEDNKKSEETTGDIIFTANGISGPAALNLSSHINLINNGSLIDLDFFPELSEAELEKYLQNLFSSKGQKDFKNILAEILKPKLVPLIIKLGGFKEDKKANSITKDERKILLKILKHFSLNVIKVSSYDKAMVTVGGLDLKEVDPKTMQSKIISNLYIAGELLDLNGPTGGYNLQICWSTGYVAGENAIN